MLLHEGPECIASSCMHDHCSPSNASLLLQAWDDQQSKEARSPLGASDNSQQQLPAVPVSCSAGGSRSLCDSKSSADSRLTSPQAEQAPCRHEEMAGKDLWYAETVTAKPCFLSADRGPSGLACLPGQGVQRTDEEAKEVVEKAGHGVPL